MRITTQYTQLWRTADLMQSEARLQETQDRLATGLKIERPSDAPGQIGTLLHVQAQIAENQARQSDITAATPHAEAGENALTQMSQDVESIRTLAMQANSATAGPDELTALTNQITTLTANITQLANSQYNGTYVFGGTATGTAPFSGSGPVTYTGNTSPLKVSLPGDQPFDISVTGDKIANAQGGTDLFQNLSSLATAVKNGDTAGITSGLNRLQTDFNNLTGLAADLGSRLQYLNTVQGRLQDQLTTSQQMQSNLKDVDMAQATVDEQTAVTTQQAALLAMSQTSNLSLVNYLR